MRINDLKYEIQNEEGKEVYNLQLKAVGVAAEMLVDLPLEIVGNRSRKTKLVNLRFVLGISKN